MASFAITGCSVISAGGSWVNAGGGIYTLSGANQSGTLVLAFLSTAALTGTGFSPTTIAGAPSGFTPTNNLAASIVSGLNANSPSTLSVQVAGAISNSLLTAGPTIPTNTPFLSLWSPFVIVTAHTAIFSDSFSVNTGQAAITGNYKIVSYSWTLPVTTNVKAGDNFTINNGNVNTGAPGVAGGLDGVAAIQLQYVDANGNLHVNNISFQEFYFQTWYQIQFFFPQFGNITNGTTVYIVAIINKKQVPSNIMDNTGTQFEGSVLIGSVTITFADASGIYVLEEFKTTDSVYNPASRGTVVEKNIQDPFVLTAFLP